MDRLPVSSSNLASVGYDPSSMTLEIEFKDGSLYQYFDVPVAVYQGLMNADSKGTFFSQNLRNDYRYTRL
ncbi:MAG: KTSC domain-containing protein [Chitinispirillaceae bacterium]|jgi:hypothetical protein